MRAGHGSLGRALSSSESLQFFDRKMTSKGILIYLVDPQIRIALMRKFNKFSKSFSKFKFREWQANQDLKKFILQLATIIFAQMFGSDLDSSVSFQLFNRCNLSSKHFPLQHDIGILFTKLTLIA